MIEINPQPLTKITFEPFGDIIETDGAENFTINNGTTTRFHDLAKIQTFGENAKSMISICHGQAFSLPLTIKMMERHPLGSQAFIAFDEQPFMVVVARDEDGVPGVPVAFLAGARQGINYHANIWHHPLIALGTETGFLVVDRGGDGNNLEEYFYPEPFQLIE